MSVTVPTKVQENVQEKRVKHYGRSWELEDDNEKYIKSNMGIRE